MSERKRVNNKSCFFLLCRTTQNAEQVFVKSKKKITKKKETKTGKKLQNNNIVIMYKERSYDEEQFRISSLSFRRGRRGRIFNFTFKRVYFPILLLLSLP